MYDFTENNLSKFAGTLLLYGLLISQACQPNTAANKTVRDRTEQYGTGAISRKYQEVNGKKEGKMIDYYPDGRLKAERWFEADKQTGRTVLYFPSGKIMEVQYYENGKKEGGDTLFYESGRPQFVLWYKGEKKHGFLRKWTPEGAPVFEARYENDSLVEVKGKKIHPDSSHIHQK